MNLLGTKKMNKDQMVVLTVLPHLCLCSPSLVSQLSLLPPSASSTSCSDSALCQTEDQTRLSPGPAPSASQRGGPSAPSSNQEIARGGTKEGEDPMAERKKEWKERGGVTQSFISRHNYRTEVSTYCPAAFTLDPFLTYLSLRLYQII